MSAMVLSLAAAIVLVGAAQWIAPSLNQPTVWFGVRIPRDRAGEPVLIERRRRYRIGVCLVTPVAAAVAALLGFGPASVTIALAVQIGGGVFLYLTARSHITEVKDREGWFEGRKQVTVADTSLRTAPVRHPWPWEIPSWLVLVGTVVTGIAAYPSTPSRLAVHFTANGHPTHYADKSVISAFTPVATQVLLTGLLLALARVALRGRSQLDAEDPHASLRHRRFVAAMSRALLTVAFGANVTFLFVSLAVWDLVTVKGAGYWLLTVGPLLVSIAALLVVGVRMGQSGVRLRLAGTEGVAGSSVNRDDDRLWKGGLVYYNPDDPAVWIPRRFGVGWTVNLARPGTWAFVGFLALLLVVGSLLGHA